MFLTGVKSSVTQVLSLEFALMLCYCQFGSLQVNTCV